MKHWSCWHLHRSGNQENYRKLKNESNESNESPKHVFRFIFFIFAFQEGFIRGVATIRQLFGVALAEGWSRVPAQMIRDQPRFGHRGLMLDVSRHFFELSFLKRLLDPRILVWSFAELWKMCF